MSTSAVQETLAQPAQEERRDKPELCQMTQQVCLMTQQPAALSPRTRHPTAVEVVLMLLGSTIASHTPPQGTGRERQRERGGERALKGTVHNGVYRAAPVHGLLEWLVE